MLRRASPLLALISLPLAYACSSSDKEPTGPGEPDPAVVRVLVNGSDVTSVEVGGSVTVSWTCRNTISSCTASGAWSGKKSGPSGSEATEISETGTLRFILGGENEAGVDAADTAIVEAGEPVPASVEILSGNNQQGEVGLALSDSLVVRVLSKNRIPVPDAAVSWNSEGDGSISPASSKTNSSGIASASWILATVATSHQAQASVSGAGSATFIATAVPGPIAVVSVSPDSAVFSFGELFQFSAAAEDSFGNPISNRQFGWSSSNASIATVDSTGLATGVALGTVEIIAEVSSISGSASVSIGARATTDRIDDLAGNQVHLVYATASDGDDNALDSTAVIENGILAVQNWFRSETSNRQVRLDTHNGNPDITFVRFQEPRSEIDGSSARVIIKRLLKDLGFDEVDKIYLVYYEGSHPSACGEADFFDPVAALYLQSDPGNGACVDFDFADSPNDEPGRWDYVAYHELFHAFGVVDDDAPNANGKAHVTDHTQDIMYEGSDPGPRFPKILDVSRDDYYNESGLPAAITNIAESPFIDG